MSERTDKLWELLLEGEPEADESIEITSSMVNQQTMERMQEMGEGQFGRDLQEDLKDPEFRAAFEEETLKIQAQQENQGGEND